MLEEHQLLPGSVGNVAPSRPSAGRAHLAPATAAGCIEEDQPARIYPNHLCAPAGRRDGSCLRATTTFCSGDAQMPVLTLGPGELVWMATWSTRASLPSMPARCSGPPYGCRQSIRLAATRSNRPSPSSSTTCRPSMLALLQTVRTAGQEVCPWIPADDASGYHSLAEYDVRLLH